MWIGIAAAQNSTGERQIVGAESSRPAANVDHHVQRERLERHPPGQRRAGQCEIQHLASGHLQPAPKNVCTTQDAQTSTAPPPMALQK